MHVRISLDTLRPLPIALAQWYARDAARYSAYRRLYLALTPVEQNQCCAEWQRLQRREAWQPIGT